MQPRSVAGATILLLALTACSARPAPSETATAPSAAAPAECDQDLPPRTSPTDYPLAVLGVGNEDLVPVVGEVEWLGGDEPVSYVPPRAVHLERFVVLQPSGEPQVTLRMSDGVAIGAWTVGVVPGGQFRSGDLNSDRIRWSEGSEETRVVCLPVQDGEWAVIADITFADGGGSGTYYWRLNISGTPGA